MKQLLVNLGLFLLFIIVIFMFVVLPIGCGDYDRSAPDGPESCADGEMYHKGECWVWDPEVCCTCLMRFQSTSTGQACISPGEYKACVEIIRYAPGIVRSCGHCYNPCWGAFQSND